MSNELNNIICLNADGAYEGVAIGGDRYHKQLFSDYCWHVYISSQSWNCHSGNVFLYCFCSGVMKLEFVLILFWNIVCRYPGTTFIDHVLRYQDNDEVKMIVLLGEVLYSFLLSKFQLLTYCCWKLLKSYPILTYCALSMVKNCSVLYFKCTSHSTRNNSVSLEDPQTKSAVHHQCFILLVELALCKILFSNISRFPWTSFGIIGG